MPVGIIAEYNPFHNGHQYQLEQARRLARKSGIEDDRAIIVMSGNYVQRGMPAIIDKFFRTRLALQGGASMVIELPTLYSTATAEKFAFGGVSLLMHSGIVDALSFGSEYYDPAVFDQAADLLLDESIDYKDHLKGALNTGMTFARARQSALESILKAPVPTEPNQILALEYIKAIKRISAATSLPAPVLLPVERKGVQHDAAQAAAGYAPASLIREMLLNSSYSIMNMALLCDWLPLSSLALLQELRNERGDQAYVNPELVLSSLQYALASHTPETLSRIDEVSEGLENRILSAVQDASSLEKLIAEIKSKRYPQSRIQRILLNTYLNITKDLKSTLQFDQGPSYIRVLGVRKGDEDLLSKLSANASLPVLIRPVDDREKLSPVALAAFNEELRFGRLYQHLDPTAPANELSMGLIRE